MVFRGFNVVVHDLLWVVVVDVSPFTIGFSWCGVDFLRFLVFVGVNVLIYLIVCVFKVKSDIFVPFVLNFTLSDGVLVNSFISFSIELKSVMDISVDVSLHSGSSVIVVFVGFNGGEEGGNHKCRLFHFGLVKKFNLKI